jgi:hypothetical protein
MRGINADKLHKPSGFAAMSEKRKREIQSMGGKTRTAKGFSKNPELARIAQAKSVQSRLERKLKESQ